MPQYTAVFNFYTEESTLTLNPFPYRGYLFLLQWFLPPHFVITPTRQNVIFRESQAKLRAPKTLDTLYWTIYPCLF